MNSYESKNKILFEIDSDQSNEEDTNNKVSQRDTEISEINRPIQYIASQIIQIRQKKTKQPQLQYRQLDSTQRNLTQSVDFLKISPERNYISLANKNSILQSSVQMQQQQEEEEQKLSSQEYDQYEQQAEIKLKRSKEKFLKTVIIQEKFNKAINDVIPKGYILRCLITIQSRMMGLSSKYNLELSDNKQFLLSAKKQLMKTHANYLISRNRKHNQINKRNQYYIGQLTSNFIGTQFIYQKAQNQEDICIISYQKNIMGFKGPRRMKVIKVNPKVKKQSLQNSLTRLLAQGNSSKLSVLQSVLPKIINGKYTLNFKQKVKIPSAKNFILEDSYGQQCLVFAKQSQECFRMEICYPLSLIQGFAICLSSLDSKLMCN